MLESSIFIFVSPTLACIKAFVSFTVHDLPGFDLHKLEHERRVLFDGELPAEILVTCFNKTIVLKNTQRGNTLTILCTEFAKCNCFPTSQKSWLFVGMLKVENVGGKRRGSWGRISFFENGENV